MASSPLRVPRVYARWMFDEKTREESAPFPRARRTVLGDIEVPFTVVQNLGYFNLHQYGSYDLFDKPRPPPTASG